MTSIEFVLLAASGLILLSIFISKASGSLGIPALLVFLTLGILAGSEGIGGIAFDDPKLTQSLGVIALSYILFEGGIETKWREIKPVLWQGISLSTLGSLITAGLIAGFLHYVFSWDLKHGFLLGAVLSSTDAAAVFAVLKTSNLRLKRSTTGLVELESGSNDPMAVFLTVSAIEILQSSTVSIPSLIGELFFEMSVGALVGFMLGRMSVMLINHMRLHHEGLYSVLTLAIVLFTYSTASILHGNGFLAVYISAIVMAQYRFFHKRTLIRFHGGIAWLMQIMMFLTLGLLVSPRELVPVMPIGLGVALFLVFIVRPAAVMLSLALTKINWREKIMIAWLGLKGAVPIILATFPLLAGIEGSKNIFNIVFFVVVISVLVQSPTIKRLALSLKVNLPISDRTYYRREHGPTLSENSELTELIVPYNSPMIDKPIMSLNLPEDAIVMLISREEGTIVPTGRTTLQGGDILTVLADQAALSQLMTTLTTGIRKKRKFILTLRRKYQKEKQE